MLKKYIVCFENNVKSDVVLLKMCPRHTLTNEANLELMTENKHAQDISRTKHFLVIEIIDKIS